jgi:putative transposase
MRVASLHERVTNQRDDFLHKLSRYYVNHYELIAVEDLNIRGMLRNHKLSSSISDVAWNKFAEMLAYKAGNAGKLVVRVDPRNTTQRCSRCGRIVKKSLAVRMHRCPYCGLKLDRDYNSAIDILKLGLEKLPQGLRELTPVEILPLQPSFRGWLQVGSWKQELHATPLNFVESLEAHDFSRGRKSPPFPTSKLAKIRVIIS